MSNEQLAAVIQAGERNRLPELWGQVEQFVRLQARRRASRRTPAEDLYQSGWLAFLAAVETYDPAAGMAFVGWLALHLRTAFAAAEGRRSVKQAQDPIHRAQSLDAPLSGELEGLTLGDLIEAPTAIQRIQEAERGMDNQRLHAALEQALTALPEAQADVIRRKYYQGRDVDAKAHAAALRALRHPSISRQLRGFL